jgi:glycerol-3-phosphate dehydrogenase (NAD(P)+)
MNYLVIGAGSWGTAFANVLAENGHPTCLWTREASVYHEINSEKRNSRYLPGVRLHSDLGIVDNLDQALERKPDVVVFAIPSHALAEFGRENKALFADKLRGDAVLLSLTKGIENDTLLRVDEILQRDFNRSDTRFAALSGPSHAEEVARKMPTAVVCAAYDHNLAAKLQEELSNAYFRVYSSTDVAGVEIGGSIKNVFALPLVFSMVPNSVIIPKLH